MSKLGSQSGEASAPVTLSWAPRPSRAGVSRGRCSLAVSHLSLAGAALLAAVLAALLRLAVVAAAASDLSRCSMTSALVVGGPFDVVVSLRLRSNTMFKNQWYCCFNVFC